ncbi:guanine nucleotide-binding protein G(I)/G(S)/G(O) subunit gamma-7-like [Xenia sp. Carnegie-2017]|uniref:guanine nucleotide-binding protein G(I)/G(S)/G(O) subunit gamma-7-like n=1 Tax=Xenia sp. Carnegie-2017 TaxID=2897299 RepID=UPI001F038EB9|nr:guanine nucleotide-binding protein G(I)/G(S)/G(O) subunit gamma-7-like [Xenia sp. Carnegie-2017]
MFHHRHSDLPELQQEVAQLRREVKIRRMKVSQVSNDIIQYCESNMTSDPLVMKIPMNENPFRDRSRPCVML